VTWLICGNDDRIAEQLPVPTDQKITQEGVQPDQWPRTVASFDIGVAPLYGPYDQRRSWIKGLEYMLGKVPWVATGGEPYRDIKAYGRLLPNGTNNWIEALEFSIANLQTEQAIATRNRAVAEQWFIDNQLGAYKNVYRQVRQRFTKRGVTALPGVYYVRASNQARITGH